jgi:predicted ATPase
MDEYIDTFLLTLIIGSLIILIFKRNSNYYYNSEKKSNLKHKNLVNDNYDSHDVFRIVITGGPCAGKTTGINKLVAELSDSVKVFVVPEAATLLLKGGAIINLDGQDANSQVEFQASLMQLQMALEDAFTEIASSFKEKSLVICDRGLMDGSAYINSDLWQALLDEKGWTVVHLRDRRYEAVVHLATAANGAEEFYTLANNEARYEGIQDAIKVDNILQQAWAGHSHLNIVDNFNVKNFEEKIDKLYHITLMYIGSAITPNSSRKYLLKSSDSIPNLKEIYVVKIYIEDTFLKSSKSKIVKIQKRGQSNSYIYTHSVKDKIDKGEYSVNKCQITASEYMILGSEKDTSRKIIKRMRQCFIYKNKYFMLNTYLNVKSGISVLRVDSLKDISDIEIPSDLDVLREVTNDPGYSTYIMSKINWYVSSRDRDIILDQ